MPPSMPDQQAELARKARRRLIGAIVLVLLMVVFLPMVLDHEPKPIARNVPITLPARPADAPAAPASTTQLPPEDAAASAPSARVKPEQTTTEQTTREQIAEQAAPERPAREQAAPERPAPVHHEAPKVAATEPGASTAAGGFVVQIGAFSGSDKADQARRKVSAAGLPVFTENISVEGQTRIRVRAGPFAQRSEAEAALEKLNEAGLGGKLMLK